MTVSNHCWHTFILMYATLDAALNWPWTPLRITSHSPLLATLSSVFLHLRESHRLMFVFCFYTGQIQQLYIYLADCLWSKVHRNTLCACWYLRSHLQSCIWNYLPLQTKFLWKQDRDEEERRICWGCKQRMGWQNFILTEQVSPFLKMNV